MYIYIGYCFVFVFVCKLNQGRTNEFFLCVPFRSYIAQKIQWEENLRKKNIECIFSDYGAIRESVSISVFMWTVWHMHKTTRVFLLTSSYFPSKLFTILIDWNGKPLKIIFIYFTYLFSFHTNNNGFFVVVVGFSEAPRNSLIYWALKQGNFEKNFKEIETLNTLNPVCTWLNNFFHK